MKWKIKMFRTFWVRSNFFWDFPVGLKYLLFIANENIIINMEKFISIYSYFV